MRLHLQQAGDVLFTKDGLEKLVNSVNAEQRPKIIQFILDFISYLKEKLAGNKDITLELIGLESKYAEMLREANTREAYGSAKSEAQKNTAKSSGVKYLLTEYSQQQINSWSNSKKIVIYKNPASLIEFVEKSVLDPSYKAKMYFGTIGKELAQAIKNNTSLDLLGRNVTLRADNIRKILKPEAHGDAVREKSKKQIAVKKSDFAKIIDVMGLPDTIELSKKEYEGKPAVVFTKTVNEQKVTVIAVDSGGSLDLFVQTMYIGKNKGNIADTLNGNTFEQTSETTVGTVPILSISTPDKNVNTKYSVSEQAQSVDNYTEEQYNNFGWARYNGILESKDVKYITEEIQKIKNRNIRGYVLTQYGDYIIPLGNQYNVLVYTDDNVVSPHIRKVLKIESEDQLLLDSIRRDILNANSERLQMADDYVRRIYGSEYFVEHKRQNFPSFRRYIEAKQEGMAGRASGGVTETRLNRRNTVQQNSGIDKADLKESAFSMHEKDNKKKSKDK